MTMQTESARRAPMKPGEEGYVLVAVIFLLAILVLSLTIAIPRVKASIQRDREIETMHRGLQYARAIKLYHKKFSAYPPNVEALVKTNEIRFLRKRYTDPMTGKDDWRPIKFGENKTPMAMGFFGQPLGLGGDAIAGTGPSGGNTGAGGTATGGAGTGTGTGTGIGTTGTGLGSGTGSGQSFGGVGIVGFAPGSTKESILLYKKKNHYNEWEFLYSPLSDRQGLQSGNTGTIGTPVAAPTGGPSVFGGGTQGTGTGSGSGSGSGGTSSTPQ